MTLIQVRALLETFPTNLLLGLCFEGEQLNYVIY